MLACWWIAIKFEEITCEHVEDIAHDVGMVVAYRDMVVDECGVLSRIDFRIPYHTATRHLYESITKHDDTTTAWLYAILYFDMMQTYPARTWRELVMDHRARLYTPVIVQIFSYTLPKRMATSMRCRTLPKRITLTPCAAAPKRSKTEMAVNHSV